MSEWRLKGFVQDSDEEEEDLEISQPRSSRESQHDLDRRVHEWHTTARDVTTKQNEEEGDQNRTGSGTSPNASVSAPIEASHKPPPAYATAPPAEDVSHSRPATPISDHTEVSRREPTDSPDPLQISLTPKAKHNRNIASSPQSLGVPLFSQDAVAPTEAVPGKVSSNSLLAEFGIFPLSDASQSELSDPPSDIEEIYQEETSFASPQRRTAVQVLIPRAATAQETFLEQQAHRSFRQRKPIQLHPYVLEGERYRRELQGRGIRPVPRPRSPERRPHLHDAETQEQEFNPNTELPSSSPPEIPVSTPIVRRRREDDPENSVQRTRTNPRSTETAPSELHSVSGIKKRKPGRPSTQAAASRQRISERNGRPARDIWAIPQSPPHSSSPLVNDAKTAGRSLIGRPATISAPDLPTPSQSSSVQGDIRHDHESEEEHPMRSALRSTHHSRQRFTIPAHGSSSDSESTRSELGPSEIDLKKVRKRIKGVLPASWLRLDRQAQEKRTAQARERLAVIQSPEKADNQRGVAQRVQRRRGSLGSNAKLGSGKEDIVTISDGSDSEPDVATQRAANLQQSAHAASNLAAILDRRYADDDSDNMENDSLHLFTLGGTSRKRKKQSKLTDVFAKTKKPKLSKSHAKISAGTRARLSGTTKHLSRKARRMPPPAMSVIDFASSHEQRHEPQFLKIAKRQARRRPDQARQSPTNKCIMLHTSHDTEDANITLRRWRSGALKPREKLALSDMPMDGRRPLAAIEYNQQRSQRSQSSGNDAITERSVRQDPTAPTPRPRQRQNIPPGLLIFQRTGNSSKAPLQGPVTPRLEHGNSRRNRNQKQLAYRMAQLEGLETKYGQSDRRSDFRNALQQVDRQFNLHLPLTQPSRNPQLARFLADNDAILPPLPSAEDLGEQDETLLMKEPPPRKRRLVRKFQAQRVDIDTRAYRQPSEPCPDAVLREGSQGPRPFSVLDEDKELLILKGLGPYGTRYPTTFDISPLRSDVYFHSTTFIGSMELHRALQQGTEKDARNLSVPAGYCVIGNGETTVRCGPWDDETYSLVAEMMDSIWQPLELRSSSADGQAELRQQVFHESSQVIRSLIAYITTHLSFLDPIDREAFARRMKQFIESMLNRILAAIPISADTRSLSEGQPTHIRTLTFLLVLSMQIRQIARNSLVDPSVALEMSTIMRRTSKLIVTHLVQRMSQLHDFLERNQRFKEREMGIQESEVLAESVVVCMHVLAVAETPGSAFWDLVSQQLSPQAQNAQHLREFETLWMSLFTLLPFIELDTSGVPVKEQRLSFKDDNWTLIRDLLKRLFTLYARTYRTESSSLNDYVRANLARCHVLIQFWHWERCDTALSSIFDFFGKNNLRQLRHEQTNGSVRFLEHLSEQPSFSIETNNNSFHVFLKCVALGLRGMRSAYPEKKIRSIVFRLTPNHGRTYPKDQPLDAESLDALRNHHDLLCTLYWASPPACRPKLELVRGLVHHEHSHREACRLNVRAWANLTAFQLSTDEPYASARPFANWHLEMVLQMLNQYRSAKTEVEDYLKSGILDSTDATSLMVRQTMEKNQEQVIATLRDCIAGMHTTIEKNPHQPLMREFLMDSGLIRLIELPHFDDKRLVSVIKDTLKVLRAYAKHQKQLLAQDTSQQNGEESQDYGAFPNLDEMDMLDQADQDQSSKLSPLGFIQTPLWHLLSNAFGAEAMPEDTLLMDCIDTWALIAGCQVAFRAQDWPYFINPIGQVSWQQLRRTDQTQKFGPYFMAALVTADPVAYIDNRLEFLNALVLSLADREATLRFQHRLLQAIARVAPSDPVMRNLPFSLDDRTSELDITAETLRGRRLTLISSILANMQDHFHATIRDDPVNVAKVKQDYADILKNFMTAMKNNYRQLRQGTPVTGAYVEFVQKIVQFLQQYTADLCPVLDFFTNSAAFPLPATDPTYVIGRLCGYAPKLARPGVAKQLSVFVQTIAQQAAAGNQQSYLVNQLKKALCTDEAPSKDSAALRHVLLQGIIPAYIEAAFASVTGFAIAKPILQSVKSVLEATFFDIRVFDKASVQSTYESTVAISHAFIRSMEKAKENEGSLNERHFLQATSLMLDSMIPVVSILDYLYGRYIAPSTKPSIVVYIEQLAVFIAQRLHRMVPNGIPSYNGDAHASQTSHTGLVSFCIEGLETSMKTNWSVASEHIYFGQGHARREVIIDVGTVEEEKARVMYTIENFYEAIASFYGGGSEDSRIDQERGWLGDIDV